ncbi:hypothetical protein B0H11DRAFT_1990831 [Mycena galericulata]|nr:hypothetical protein B0H11DRAFT_1990831 [Mycena galericulata]
MATQTIMPPTTHTITHAQRLRLMRSTRKLGSLLGETPLVVESQSSSAAPSVFTPSHSRSSSTMSTESKRSGRYFMHPDTTPRSSSLGLSAAPPAAQTTSHAASSSMGSHVPRPMLFLRLPVPGADSALTAPAERTPLPSPLSPTFSLVLNTPPTPPADASRRRKMAKLVRTLGENVPPELVFPASSSRKSRRRASTLSVAESVHEQRQRGGDLVYTVEEPFSFPSTVPVPEGRASSDSHNHASTTVVAEYSSSSEYLLPPLHVEGGGMHRKEKGWSGEWNGVGNMEDVVRSLRGLKMK